MRWSNQDGTARRTFDRSHQVRGLEVDTVHFVWVGVPPGAKMSKVVHVDVLVWQQLEYVHGALRDVARAREGERQRGQRLRQAYAGNLAPSSNHVLLGLIQAGVHVGGRHRQERRRHAHRQEPVAATSQDVNHAGIAGEPAERHQARARRRIPNAFVVEQADVLRQARVQERHIIRLRFDHVREDHVVPTRNQVVSRDLLHAKDRVGGR